MSIFISDSTLRDGNHAIRHQLTAEQIAGYAAAADAAGIDIVEVGHGNGLGASSSLLGHAAVDDRTMLAIARERLKCSRLGVHFIPGFGKASDIDMALDIGVDVIRVASHCTEANITARFIEQTKAAGKEAYGVLMMAHMASPEVLRQQAQLMERYGADAIVLMDSAGFSSPAMVRDKVRCLLDYLDVRVGFHAHNNLGMAIANTLVAVEEGATVVDGCFKGFGAGAGNAQLEIMVAVLERHGYPICTSFDLVGRLSAEVSGFLCPETPHIDSANIASGLYGLFSGYVPHVRRAAQHFDVDEFELYRRLADRRLVAGQEDVITEEASRLASSKRMSTLREFTDEVVK
ncbi:4-hydroxy-2-oxovalerate aldolase [Burkholderia sp. Bp9140]|uniref:4-hydroxy-2-oxovalerate aldolase n=1 Tax=Burkholderia sp. Bp9140 TaxID=2184572 RepID=UPI000F573B48|nr:4-hydroxy-2-oxovalerate aldolase [Burkholderia sp. Bp9140]RQR43957.1 4-hydroxy-2-oxovalerate aldolase [Burkholderia sp. Bp9140]